MPGDYIEDRRQSKKDRLIAYLSSKHKDEEMEQLWKQYEYVEDKLRSMKKINAMHVICKKFDIGRASAYKLIKEVEIFSGIAHAPDKAYLTWVQIERLQRDIELASAKGDFGAVARLSSELRNWLYDPNEMDLGIMEKLQLHQFNIQINVNGDTAQVPLETFYKLKEGEKKALAKSQKQEFASWEEMKVMLDAKG